MAKKFDEAEVKKECPSCGLGVALDATICEFCGWDFEEEDEWILQIEKLERDLMLEKQKFEPGSVEEKIEATLHLPADEMKAMKAAEKRPGGTVSRAPIVQNVEPPPRPAPQPSPEPKPQRKLAAAAPIAPSKTETTPLPKVRRVRTMKPAPSQTTRTQSTPLVEATSDSDKKKVRLVRKVKQ